MGGFLSPLPQSKRIERYVVALVLAVVAIASRWMLDPVLGHVAFYITLYAAVAASSLIAGLAPSILTAVVGLTGVLYWFVDPRTHRSLLHPQELQSIAGCVIACALLIAFGEANRRKQLTVSHAFAELQAESNERRRAEDKLRQAHAELEQRVEERTCKLSEVLGNLESEITVRQEAQERYRALTVHLMTLQDQERRRIGRDLHDNTGQTLAAMKMTLAMLQRISSELPKVSELVKDLDSLTENAIHEVRTASYLLHPPLLDEAGFVSAARWYVEGFADRSAIRVQCHFPDELHRLPKECELALFRVLQESLTNVHRYAGATNVTVKLAVETDELRFEVNDDGCGIPPERLRQLQDSNGNFGVGIAGMRERMRELGGRLEIRSDGKGTILSVSLPITNKPSLEANSGVSAA
jgi:signal transduction histidine kinase